MKTYSILIQDILPLIKREVSRVAAASFSEDGTPLYDSIVITSRDEEVVQELMDMQDAQLRKKLRFALKKGGAVPPVDGYAYAVSVSDEFDDALCAVVKKLMTQYIVKGVLLEWCERKGVQTTAVSAEEVLQIEDDIVSHLRTPSYRKAPLQPFGPR